MLPCVYLFLLHTNELVENTTPEPLIGIAFALDENTVFHAYPDHLANPYGKPLTCLLYSGISSMNPAEQSEKEAIIIHYCNNEGKLNGKAFYKNGASITECTLIIISNGKALSARSEGLLETDALAAKTVAVIGLGSGGSAIALELAKAGIGKFILIDYDRLEASNIARHICGIQDLGRYKTWAVKDLLLQKNPFASVIALEKDIVQHRDACLPYLSQADLLIAATDNDRSRFMINDISLNLKITAIYGRALTRAAGGDVLRVRPFTGPCYNCLYSQNIRQAGSDDEEISQMKQAKKLLPAYTSEEDRHALVQVGLSSDIAPIANLMVKLALVELSRGMDTGIRSLEEDLTADFYIWANRRENIYAQWPKMGYGFTQPGILRWYGAKVSRDPQCIVCATET
ncbi:MAG: hypothetical protein KatS3mg031_2689 [Chitinophagales bacterium]|nr:MAG: hypothetical protein KatS3mg031_2689 [Chitinophagales bacterium]